MTDKKVDVFDPAYARARDRANVPGYVIAASAGLALIGACAGAKVAMPAVKAAFVQMINDNPELRRALTFGMPTPGGPNHL